MTLVLIHPVNIKIREKMERKHGKWNTTVVADGNKKLTSKYAPDQVRQVGGSGTTSAHPNCDMNSLSKSQKKRARKKKRDAPNRAGETSAEAVVKAGTSETSAEMVQ